MRSSMELISGGGMKLVLDRKPQSDTREKVLCALMEETVNQFGIYGRKLDTPDISRMGSVAIIWSQPSMLLLLSNKAIKYPVFKAPRLAGQMLTRVKGKSGNNDWRKNRCVSEDS